MHSTHAQEQLGKNYQHLICSRIGSLSQQKCLRCIKARYHWIYQGHSPWVCQTRNYLKRHLPRVGFDSLDWKTNRYHRQERQNNSRASFKEVGRGKATIRKVQFSWWCRRTNSFLGQRQRKTSKWCCLDNGRSLDCPMIMISYWMNNLLLKLLDCKINIQKMGKWRKKKNKKDNSS